MSEMKDLRNYINKVANQHTESVDRDALWAGIEQKMKKPKKKRHFPPFLIWGLSLSFVLLTLSVLYISTKDKSPITNNIELKLEANENQQVESSKIDPQPEINSSKSEASAKAPKNNTSSVSSTINKSSKNDDVNIASKQIRENLEVVDDSKDLQNNQLDIYSTQSIKRKEILNRPTDSDPIVNSKQEINTFIRNENSTKESAISNLEKQQNVFPVERIRIDLTRITASLNLLYKRPKIEIQPVNVFSYPRLSKKKKKNFSFLNSYTVYTGYGFGSKTIQGNSEYANLRNESEKFLEHLKFGIESDLIQFLDFTLYGGLSYASINDRLIWNDTFFEDREITYLKAIRILPDGTEIETFATEELPHIINDEALRYNSHRLISVPLGLRFGKEFSKIQLGIAFGLDLNYSLSNTHTILNTDLKLVAVPVNGKWLTPSFHSGISANYPISDRWFLHSKITYRKIQIENTSIGTASKESYSIYGVDLGLKFQF